MQNLFHYRTQVERETRRRIMLSVWAYAYEFDHTSLVSDHIYDAESRLVDVSILTTRPDLDHFFRTQFMADSGMWIWQHPELEKVERLYRKWYKPKHTPKKEQIHDTCNG